ncbi:MAG: ATP-binding cassette domain-containing protein, partial [Geminicoccaceae bacterium]
MHSIRCHEVGLTYGGRRGKVETLRGVGLDIAPGEFVCLVGPSGCGKSSLLGLIAGLRTPSAGRIVVLGQPVAGPVSEL